MTARVPPHSTDAERSVLATILVRPDVLPDVLARGLVAGDFYTPRWAATFAAIVALANRGDAIDAVTVGGELAVGAYGDAVPDLADLNAEMRDVPSLDHAETYARAVVDAARLRALMGAAAEIVEAGYGPDALTDADAYFDLAEATLHAAVERRNAGPGPAPLIEVLDATIAELRRRSSGGLVGVPTGFDGLDRMTGGLRPGQLVVVGARPSMGKSALALDIALHVARTTGPALFVSAEMSELELGTRVFAGGGVPSDRLLVGRLDDVDFARLEARRAELTEAALFIDAAAGTTLLAIRARARWQAARGGLALVVVDYLQLVGAERRGTRREAEVAEVSRGLKSLARELQVPVIAVAQLNRAVELRTVKQPVLADLRESGQLEQDADVVLLLHRPVVYDLNADPLSAELHVAKHRNGPTGLVPLVWLARRMSFVDDASEGV